MKNLQDSLSELYAKLVSFEFREHNRDKSPYLLDHSAVRSLYVSDQKWQGNMSANW
jgi:hypothetical protein